MSDTEFSRQADNVTPPEAGKCIVITTDTTSRSYDLGAVSLGGLSVSNGGGLYVTLLAETADCYVFFGSTAASTVDESAAVAAGGTLAFTANACFRLVKDVPLHVRIKRTEHRYLYLKGASAGKVRLYASSQGPTR